MTSLKDKSVLITGAGRGIGKRLALGFAEAGARVGLLARSKAELDLAHLEIEHAGGISLRIRADVCDFEQMAAAAERMRSHFGGVHVLVASAAVQGPIGPLAENPPKAWAEAINTNLLGVMYSCRAVLPGMIARRAGSIVNVVSGAGCRPFADMSAYVASKTALIRLSEQMAVEAKPYGVSVFPIRPGIVRTAMVEEARQKIPQIQQALDQGLDSSTEAAANLVAFLASGQADRLSGHLFSVHDDLEKILLHAEEIERDSLYMLRARELQKT